MSNNKDVCINCQKCCKTIGIHTIYPYVTDVIEFYTVRGFKVSDRDGLVFLHLDLKCPHIIPSGCNIYHHRPQVCKDFQGSVEFIDNVGDCELYKNEE